jgi:hypothetical protein
MNELFTEQLNLAWAAGLIDGEGCIRIRCQTFKGRSYPQYTLALQLGMCCGWTIARLGVILPGSRIYVRKPQKQGHREFYHAFWFSKHAANTIRAVHPYLFTKVKEANLALEFSLLFGMHDHRSIQEKERLNQALRSAK